MNLVYSVDDNYTIPMYVSIKSFLSHHPEKSHNIFIIYKPISKKKIMVINDLVEKFGSEIIWIPFNSIANDLPKVEGFPESAFSRLFLSDLPNEIDRILYIDCDTCFNSNINEFYNQSLEGYYLIAVLDMVKLNFRTQIGLEKNNPYYNSGMLIVNLKSWRENNLKAKYIDFIEQFDGRVPHNDQGVINAVCKGKIKTANMKYNVTTGMLSLSREKIVRHFDLEAFYSKEEFNEAIQNPSIIHYTEGVFGRPWQKRSTHPFKSLYLKYLSGSPFEGVTFSNPVRNKQKLIGLTQKYLPFTVYSKLVQLKDIVK